MKNFTIRLFATGLGSGYLKPFPGTWGTIPAWLIAWFLIKGDPTMLWIVAVLTTVLSIAISFYSCPIHCKCTARSFWLSGYST
jgi:phosphatidylglycerophosphatase A